MQSTSAQAYTRSALAMLLVALVSLGYGSLIEAADNRLTASEEPAIWQQAVVKLAIPVRRWENGRRSHFIEDCTGSLIQGPKGVLILTAWHCVEGFNDLTKVIVATTSDGTTLHAQISTMGNSMASDWALLKLNHGVQSSKNIIYLELAKTTPAEGQRVLMAGFSRDQKLGKNGSALTFDPNCYIGKTPLDARAIHTNCTAFKGASGGPTLILENDTYRVLGVISAGNEAGLSLFTPIAPIARSLW